VQKRVRKDVSNVSGDTPVYWQPAGKGSTEKHEVILRNCYVSDRLTGICVRGGVSEGAAAPPGFEKFQGKLCFQGKRKLLKNPE